MDPTDKVNLALHKPATQSSLGEWAKATTLEGAAGLANNGSTRIGNCHTAREKSPWWQVDLQAPYLVKEIRVHARPSRLDRLTRVRIAGSLDGTKWKTMLRKRGDTVGVGNILLNFDAGYAARYVRLILDTMDYLDFYECEVLGGLVPPDWGTQDRKLSHEADSGANRTRVVDIGGFEVFAPAERYGALVFEALRTGRYESRERQLVRDLLRHGDRVLEVGTAIGVVTMTAAAIAGGENVMTFDANPYIVQDAQNNFLRNELGSITSGNGVLANRKSALLARPTAPFGVAEEFWASRLFAKIEESDIIELLDVPTICLEDKLAEHRANVLICDIEGGETDLLTDADLTGIRTIIMETHTRRAGIDPTNALMRKLIGQDGFNLDLGRSGQHVVGMQR